MTSLFDTQHTFGALYDTLKALAEQAFFEAAIFNAFTSVSLSREGDIYSTGPDFDKIAERVQHVELDILIIPELGWEATLKNAMSLCASVRLRSPKLKACVLTVVVQTFQLETNSDEFARGYYGSHDQNPFPKDILAKEPTPGQCLGNTLAKLFAEFAEKDLVCVGSFGFRISNAMCWQRKQHLTLDLWWRFNPPDSKPMLTRAPAEQACLLRRTNSHVVVRRSHTRSHQVSSVSGNAEKVSSRRRRL